ncbi:MAG: FMN-binding protein, partial [Clostridia bacterium]|nr:FMN-binding protein [Clostridia bacterium]
ALNKLFPAEEAVEEAPAAEVLKSSAVGFVGEDVRVNVTLDAEGAIATLEIDVSDQVPPACDLVLAEEFVNQFIGKKGPFVKGENVDGVTGATFTSDGVIAALNKLFPAEEAVEEAPAAEVLKSSAVGFVGEDVRVNVTLDAEGAIATLEIDVSDQVPPACDLVLAEEFVNQFIGKKGPFVKGENVDGVTGATFTSDGVIAALNKLFPAE